MPAQEIRPEAGLLSPQLIRVSPELQAGSLSPLAA